MLFKRIISSAMVVFLFSTSLVLFAQEKNTEKKMDHSMMQEKDMSKCMDKVASDEHMRGEMMDKMMEHTKNDSSGMMQMCKLMMDNPEMHSMMMKMMSDKSMEHKDMDHKGMMMKDKKMKHDKEPEGKNNSEHEDHHKN